MSYEEVREFALKSTSNAEEVHLEIPVYGRLYHTDSQELAIQFLMAAYVGQSIYSTCTRIECYLSPDITAHESIGFRLIPDDSEAFADELWDAIPAFLEDDESDGMAAMGAYDQAQALLNKRQADIRFPELVSRAKEILRLSRGR